MTENVDKEPALVRAQQLAERRCEPMFVVWTGSGYAVASEEDLDTWWLGATVDAEVHEDGVCTDGY